MKTQTPIKRTAHRLVAALAIATAFAATGAWAEDWPVSENTTLTEDTTVDALTVDDGVTLDLNGYKLYCTSLAGSGTITSTSADLTTPSGTVTWITKFGTENATQNGLVRTGTNPNATTPANLFNDFNGGAAPGSSENNESKRLLATTDNLPLAVTYDFGDGTPKKVNAYKMVAVRAGNSSNHVRCPKTWTFEGSNGNDEWTPLHSADNVSWKASGSSPKEFSFSNDTAYRYYRITFTASSDGVGSNKYLEVNQLEYFGPGELHVNVPAGSEATVGSLKISGNMKVVKDGEGRLNGVTGIGSSTFPGVLEVNAGTVYVADDFKLGTAADGTLTINGGTVEVNSSKATHIGASSGKTGTVNLNGGILKTKRLVNPTGIGKVNFDGGTLQANNADDNGLFGSNVAVTINAGGGTIDSGNFAVKVPAAISGTGAMRFKGGNTITHNAASTYTGGTTIELGTKISTSNTTAKNTILGGLVIDGKRQLKDATGIEVFGYSSALTDPDDLAHVTLVNCGTGSGKRISDKKIVVDFVLPVWELAADANWSELVATYGAPDADAIVRIASSGRHTLTIDTDVTVSQIVFSGTNPDVVVNTGATVTTDTITFGDSGSNYLKNDGVIVLNGTATTLLPFHNDSRGAYYINNGGRVNVSRVTTGSTTPGLVPEGANQFVCVGVNGMYDVSAVANNTASVRLAEGATIANGGNNTISPTAKQVPQLILDGDAQAKIFRSFGLTGKGDPTRLDLGEHTLKIFGGESTYSFFLYNTTVSGTGKVFVESGKLATYGNTHGDSWSLEIGTSGYFALANTPSGNTLTVGDFVNNGKDDSDSGAGALVVKGTLTPGNNVKKLTLADGSTVKATATKKQTVTTTFAVSGTGDKTITIDASAIDAETLKAAKETGIPVLTVPAVPSGVTWSVTGAAVGGTRAKWSENTLRLYPPIGLMVIFQ